MTKDKAMKMAFFAMLKIKENKSDPAFTYQDVLDAIEVLRTALAQPESEPVAWGIGNTRPTEKGHFVMLLHSKEGVQYPELLIPLYTAPPQSEWIGLTENELSQIHNSANWNHDIDWSYERAIEAKLKSLNTL